MRGVSDSSGILQEVLLKKRATSRPILSKEERTLRALETAFPSGEWVEPELASPDGGGAGPGEGAEEGTVARPPSLTIIGGTKYDEQALDDYLSDVEYDATIHTGDGRGAETWVALRGDEDYGLLVNRIKSNPDVYGKSARKVNVEAVLSFDPTSPLLLVGSGERVKQAEAWLKRANWPREVHRIG